MKKRPVVAVVLGGGGALGFAHIGALQVLEENGIHIDMVVGTSMGAIVGGAYACGANTKELEELALSVKLRQLYDLNFTFQGILTGRSAIKFIKKAVPSIDMKDTKIPYFCNAVDLVSCKEIVFKEGNIIDNIRASISCPGIFNPVRRDGMILVDGGVLNNLGHDIARREGADIIIAVDVVTDTILPRKVKGLIGCVVQSALISQKELQNVKRKYYNVLIRPNLGEAKQYVFNRESTAYIIEQGRVATRAQIDKIKDLIDRFKLNN